MKKNSMKKAKKQKSKKSDENEIFSEVRELPSEVLESGEKVVKNARTRIVEVGENVTKRMSGAKEAISNTKKNVARKIKSNPRITTAAAATLGAVGAGLIARRLVHRKGQR